ncbi:MAG: HlyD family efflux transporter periplasmic adaptor subunit [Bacteroidetes bacterium]|nr:HlyD family efflux transporter periplasmic adaptor subunit [Bacteroidota bacterium]
MKSFWFIFLACFLFYSCEKQENGSDAYGNFEAREVFVSSEANGKLVRFDVEEGEKYAARQLIGFVDTTQLYLKKLQLEAAIRAIPTKKQDAQPQIEVFEKQKKNLLREKKRVEALLKDKAATPKQLDDIAGQIEVVDKQIAAASAKTTTLNKGIVSEIEPLRVQIKQIEDQLRKSYLYNPIKGTVLLKLAEESEFTVMGKPLYKIADLQNMILKVYVSGTQLPHIKIGDQVTVLIDEDEETNRSLTGNINWISEKAEFTPKIVQTKEERVNLVYAVKIAVKNDGALKIGMPGEVVF